MEHTINSSSQVKTNNHTATGRRGIFLLIYVIIGVLIGSFDPFVLPVYLTLPPLHLLLLKLSFKTKNIMVVFYFIMLFLSHGIGSITFYLTRKKAESVGFSAIGNFDFSYERLLSDYSYLFVFCVFLILFSRLFKKRYHTNFLPKFLREQYNTIQFKSSNLSPLPILTLTIVFVMISVWMYNMHIGMIGLQQTELPYHLTGILFYLRRFVFPLILIWIHTRTRDKTTGSVVLIIYAFLVGITATSKSASLLVLVPLAYINYLIGKKNMCIVCIVFSMLVYIVVGEMRSFIYDMDAEIDILSVLLYSFDSSRIDNLFIFFIDNFTNRLYGLQTTVLSAQYQQMTFDGLLSFYSGVSITEVIPDYVKTLFGFTLPDDKAFGVGLGYNGTVILLSSHNYLCVMLQAFIIAALFSIQNNCVQRIIASDAKITYKYLALIIMLYAFMRFFDGNEILLVYVLTIVLVFLKSGAIKRQRRNRLRI